ncbi:ABCB family ABC transporter ATP-binding protein/permease [Ostreibacterium oceani]|uniref:ATP-binding cassette domain-containing protein n=1 Tax=Ostreibacterium oceani TaxID=2654998 RepID=A0A6N7EUP8_9GAMM|nr:ABC transporter ATP-binding protein/permease [Ostreibacterium oceani]MPV85240.1 ATP-binding cassette domain-containing protein [Ostreibacterium oceani]
MQSNTRQKTTKKAENYQVDWRISQRLIPYLWAYKRVVFAVLLFLILARVSNIVVPIILKYTVDALSDPQLQLLSAVVGLVIAYGVLRLSSVLFNEIRNWLFAKIRIEMLHKISMQTLAHLHNLSLRFHLDRKTGALSREMERGLQAIAVFLRNILFNIIPVLFELIAVLILIGFQFNFIFVLVILVTIVLYVVFTFLMTRWRTQFRVQMNDYDANANTRAIDSLLNYETVKLFGNEQVELTRYDAALSRWSAFAHKSTWTLSLLNLGQGLIIASGLMVLLLMAVMSVFDGESSVGDFVMLNAYMLQLYVPLSFLGSMYREINHALIDMDKLFTLLDEKADITEVATAQPLDFRGGCIEFNHITFSYDGSHRILDDISFTVPAGEMVAVVGPSGAGKSTLSRLLLRFYDPDSGAILIDNQDIRQVTLASLRTYMAAVPQDCNLFNDTIGYNIAYSIASSQSDVSQAEIERAAKMAQIHDFIVSQPKGYETLVGERGLKLSGGEKQRVAIARAALKQAKILIFDEATSSLDSRSEKAIQVAMNNVAKGQTTLVIAHRLSTITQADNIVVLDQGRVVETGTHDALLLQQGLYAQMWALQQENKADCADE